MLRMRGVGGAGSLWELPRGWCSPPPSRPPTGASVTCSPTSENTQKQRSGEYGQLALSPSLPMTIICFTGEGMGRGGELAGPCQRDLSLERECNGARAPVLAGQKAKLR